ncbi:AT hook domain-containing protein [Colletotrichum abscissum]|uniref:AT hook domain-containing protein n=1 Tax=Colletotrichum abscissum TaxID=1671311 RepID=UPI0027D6BB02|nr:AT hook domain-containing protein [Colletotrichum abscissum]KAK1492864.1 AT hook domain-containing protein [Colletotrichum abscissum]
MDPAASSGTTSAVVTRFVASATPRDHCRLRSIFRCSVPPPKRPSASAETHHGNNFRFEVAIPSKKSDPSTYVEVPDQSAPQPATVNPSDVTRVVTPTQTVFTTDYRYRIISGVSPSQASTKPSHMIAHPVIANVVSFDTHFVRQDGFASEKTASERFFDVIR